MASSTTIGVILVITTVFILLGSLLPFIRADMGLAPATPDLVSFMGGLSENLGDEAVVKGWDIAVSIISMFFWSFGALPFWVELLFTIMRVGYVVAWIFVARGI